MKKLLVLLLLFGIVGCATYSPEQLQAKASDKTDIELCFDMVLQSPNQYSKQELMNRGVDCNKPSIAEAVIEKRKKQIAMGQALMAFGNAMQSKTQPTYIPSIGSLPDYSKTNTATIKKFLTSRRALDNGRTECTYGIGITATVIVSYGSFCEPSI